MAFWDYKTGKTTHFPARDLRNGWFEIDCGCSGGIQWGGEEPTECSECGGRGALYWHKKSRVFAEYPGGPFRGKGDLSEKELNGCCR